jgi:hypothetical protein
MHAHAKNAPARSNPTINPASAPKNRPGDDGGADGALVAIAAPCVDNTMTTGPLVVVVAMVVCVTTATCGSPDMADVRLRKTPVGPVVVKVKVLTAAQSAPKAVIQPRAAGGKAATSV